MRWREYMMRVEAVIFAASQSVSRETLSAVIGSDCNLDLIIAEFAPSSVGLTPQLQQPPRPSWRGR
jgi:segregation and condensation protein B